MWATVVLYFTLFINGTMYDNGIKYEPEPTQYYLTASSGAYRGWMSFGLGMQAIPVWATEVTLGYTSEDYGGTILQTSWKNMFGYRFNKLRPYVYHETLVTSHKDTFLLQPDQYPDNYYPPTAVYNAVGVGLEYFIYKDLSTYIEISTLDYYMEAYVRNPNYFQLHEVGTYGIGFKKQIDW